MATIDQEALNEFVVESRELLEQAEADLMAFDVESQSVDPEIINRIFRAVHSVKGVAGFFGLDVISHLSHAMESLLMKVRDGEFAPTAEMIDILLKDNDRLRALVNDVNNSNSVDVSAEVAQLKELLESGGHIPSVGAAPAATQEAPKKAKAKPAKKSQAAKAPSSVMSSEFTLSEELRASLVRQGSHL